MAAMAEIPPYGRRHRWQPKTLADFGDGGAFPEILLAQFPLNMGREASTTMRTVALQTGPDGKVQYDAIVRQHDQNGTKIVHTRPDALKPLWSTEDALQRPDAETEAKIIAKTKAAVEGALLRKQAKGDPKALAATSGPEFIKYTPNQQAPGHNANCTQRVIRMVQKQHDPMEPPKFKHKRLPRGPPSPPPPVMHSPPRKVTAEDQARWKIPPAVSNWKNQKGYTIPLDKRLQAEGRNLQEVAINDKFAGLTESLLIAERAAREEIRVRNDLSLKKKRIEEEQREQQLRELAIRARAERAPPQQATATQLPQAAVPPLKSPVLRIPQEPEKPAQAPKKAPLSPPFRPRYEDPVQEEVEKEKGEPATERSRRRRNGRSISPRRRRGDDDERGKEGNDDDDVRGRKENEQSRRRRHHSSPHRSSPHRSSPHRSSPHRSSPHRRSPHRRSPRRGTPPRPHRDDSYRGSRADRREIELEEDRARRRELERERKRELEREMRIEKAGRKSKRHRDENRDISEVVALGQAQPTSQEVLFDARLFNQSAGMDSGFAGGDDEQYRLYDKPLFAARSGGIYHFEKDRLEENAGSFGASVPSFAGAERQDRSGPVQFKKA